MILWVTDMACYVYDRIHLGQVSTTRRCPPWKALYFRGIHTIIRQLSMLTKCVRGVYLKEVSHLREVSTLAWCPPQRSVHVKEVSTLERCPPQRRVHVREVSILERCAPQRGVHLTKMSTSDRCLPQRFSFIITEVSTFKCFFHAVNNNLYQMKGMLLIGISIYCINNLYFRFCLFFRSRRN